MRSDCSRPYEKRPHDEKSAAPCCIHRRVTAAAPQTRWYSVVETVGFVMMVLTGLMSTGQAQQSPEQAGQASPYAPVKKSRQQKPLDRFKYAPRGRDVLIIKRIAPGAKQSKGATDLDLPVLPVRRPQSAETVQGRDVTELSAEMVVTIDRQRRSEQLPSGAALRDKATPAKPAVLSKTATATETWLQQQAEAKASGRRRIKRRMRRRPLVKRRYARSRGRKSQRLRRQRNAWTMQGNWPRSAQAAMQSER